MINNEAKVRESQKEKRTIIEKVTVKVHKDKTRKQT